MIQKSPSNPLTFIPLMLKILPLLACWVSSGLAAPFHRSDAYRLYEVYNQSMMVSDANGAVLRYPRCGQSILEELGGGGFALFFPVGKTDEFYVNQESNVQYFKVVQGKLKRLWSATVIEKYTSAIDTSQYQAWKKQAHPRSTRNNVFLRALAEGGATVLLTNECGALPVDHRALDRFSFGHWSSRILPDGRQVCLKPTGNFMNGDLFEKTFQDRLVCKVKQ